MLAGGGGGGGQCIRKGYSESPYNTEAEVRHPKGEFHIQGTGVLIGNFEKNLKEVPRSYSCGRDLNFFPPLRATNRSHSISKYSTMGPRLSGQNCNFFMFILSFDSQKRLGYKDNNTKYTGLT